ncbi:uncharacterized protein BDZ83DRAFT_654154 [Colletotrichum acutatum]|uniref:Uncharacterized protein n=1 Tax=Glomerella acutata TaxID=27357 RepID=A0AAD8UIJ0_GLOAC|nr:uncharacterized protein BDZ83DRAFT_654154 [Colletotrichum acutatum]KAK1721370.1 hypothetical protein BDZ83DRAFT_654154 [Colletotrichum acutatum]
MLRSTTFIVNNLVPPLLPGSDLRINTCTLAGIHVGSPPWKTPRSQVLSHGWGTGTLASRCRRTDPGPLGPGSGVNRAHVETIFARTSSTSELRQIEVHVKVWSWIWFNLGYAEKHNTSMVLVSSTVESGDCGRAPGIHLVSKTPYIETAEAYVKTGKDPISR